MMTRQQFRALAELKWSTWEGATIKAVQTALHAYHTCTQEEKPAKLVAVEFAVVDWFAAHEEPPTKDRSRAKRRAMDVLLDQLENTVPWTRTDEGTLALEKGIRYRKSLVEMNLAREEIAIPKISVKRRYVEHLRFMDARQCRRKLRCKKKDFPVLDPVEKRALVTTLAGLGPDDDPTLDMRFRCTRVGHAACRGVEAMRHSGLLVKAAARKTEYGDDCIG